MKKHLLLIASLSMFAIVGCGTDDADTSADSPKSKAPAPSANADAPKVPVATTEPIAAAKPKAGPSLPESTHPVAIDELDELIAAKKVAVFDANSPGTREKFGVIPTAHLLKDTANCEAELPADKDAKLVFYCSNEMCSASHRAAKVAVKAGYSDVNILPPGIMGWVEAGKQVENKTL